MSMDPNAPYPSPGMQAGAPQKGGGSKVMLGVGIGCGIVLLLCCGGGVAMYFVFKDAIKIESNPPAVAAAGQEITAIEVPPEFQPSVAVSVNIPIINKGGTVVVYTDAPHGGGIQLFQIAGNATADEGEQIRQQMEQNLRQQGHGSKNLVLTGEPREVNFEVRGKPASFTIQKGKSQDNKEFFEVKGTFEGKGGPAILSGQLPADQIDEEKTEAFVRSIK
ncbi:MAG TPA: hypothetical protein VGN42_27480 [Pirellulales bacterium]|jgi:hypothetical protein|nr:hypothetical protein [Pirellulales bacterium]